MAQQRNNQKNPIGDVLWMDKVVTVELLGDIDMHQASVLRNNLLTIFKKNPTTMIVDLGKVEFMDSSGLATLIEALQISRTKNCELKLAAMAQRVKSIFEISRLDKIFKIYDSKDQALGK